MKNFILMVIVFVSLFVLSGCTTPSAVDQTLPTTSGVQEQPQANVETPVTPVVPLPKPASKTYTMQDVQKHTTASDCWTVVNGSIYNVSNFSSTHPGGADPILSVCGKDGTSVFNKKHEMKFEMLQKFFVAKVQ